MAEFLTHHRKKLFIVFLISALLMVGLCAQLGFLMIARSDHYSKMADELHKRERTIKAARGEIVDRNGTVIAANRTVCTVSVIHNQVTEPEKVIREHATIGILVTTDGSFTDIPRENYVPAEERTVQELKKIGKPFVVLLNTPKPHSNASMQMSRKMKETYGVSVLPVNCEQLKQEDICRILQEALYEFPVTELDFYLPKWVEMLPISHKIKAAAIAEARRILEQAEQMKDIAGVVFEPEKEEISSIRLEVTDLACGTAKICFQVDEHYYYENISELAGVPIHGEYELISLLRELSEKRDAYAQVADAMESVKRTGYGVVSPSMDEISVEEPELIRHGNQYGVRLKASSPSIHMIQANIETEIAPIIGSEEQAKDLVSYIKENQNTSEGLWKTNIFGKSLGELVEDGIRRKITMMDEESQQKLQDTMKKIVNDNNGGLVCIIL